MCFVLTLGLCRMQLYESAGLLCWFHKALEVGSPQLVAPEAPAPAAHDTCVRVLHALHAGGLPAHTVSVPHPPTPIVNSILRLGCIEVTGLKG